MLDVKPAAKLWVLVLQRIERVRISRNDLLELCLPKGLQILFNQLLEETFLAHAADIIAGIRFVLVEDSEIKSGALKDSRDHFCVGYHALIKGSCIADKPEILHGFFDGVLDGELHFFRPASTQALAFA